MIGQSIGSGLRGTIVAAARADGEIAGPHAVIVVMIDAGLYVTGRVLLALDGGPAGDEWFAGAHHATAAAALADLVSRADLSRADLE